MIQPLRQLHGRVFVALGITLPALFVSGIASRQSLPKPPAPRIVTSEFTPVAEQTVQVSGSPLRLLTFRDSEGIALQISSPSALNAPDVLVYAATTESKDTVTDDTTFLGAYAPDKLYRLPAQGARCVVLYSLGHQQVLASFPLEGRP